MTEQPDLYHGTKADLRPGDLIVPGHMTNFGTGRVSNHVYLAANLDAAIWGAELAEGAGCGRIYRVEPMGEVEDDPNLTDRKFPGNPTRSYRSRSALRVRDEVKDWVGHAPEILAAMRASVARLRQAGIEAEDD